MSFAFLSSKLLNQKPKFYDEFCFHCSQRLKPSKKLNFVLKQKCEQLVGEWISNFERFNAPLKSMESFVYFSSKTVPRKTFIEKSDSMLIKHCF